MKRFLAFYNQDYYPSGGMNDFIGDFETLEEAVNAVTEKDTTQRNAIKASWEKQGNFTYEWKQFEDMWAHIWDIETNTEAWST